MLTKNQVKFIKNLQQKKFRKEAGLFVAEGTRLVNDLIQSKLITIRHLYAVKEWDVPAGMQSECITDAELSQISGLESPNQVVALCEIPLHDLLQAISSTDLIIALDNIQDPGNLGTIIRIADWFGITHLVCSENTVEAYNPKVIQASMGAVSRVKIYYSSLAPFIEEKKKKGTAIYAAMLNGADMYTAELQSNAVLLMGNEGQGVSEALLKIVNKPVTIPAFAHATPYQTQAESLNVAVATAILCAAFRKP